MRLTSENSSGSGTGLRGSRPCMDYLPIFLQLRGRPVLVVGGGRVASRKVDLLRRTGARITIVAPDLLDELRELAAKGDLQHIETVFVPSHVTGTAAVVAATGLTEVNAAVSAAAREQNIPVNVVDDPSISTFIFPAIVDRSPILIAISSGGQAPVLARPIREQMEALLPARLGALARFMG